jgi:hypothetical protein
LTIFKLLICKLIQTYTHAHPTYIYIYINFTKTHMRIFICPVKPIVEILLLGWIYFTFWAINLKIIIAAVDLKNDLNLKIIWWLIKSQ